MSQVRAFKITLNQLIESDAINSATKCWIVPKKATVLDKLAGTLVSDEHNDYYLITAGEWFRSEYFNKSLPQVDDFNKLQDLGFTAIKDAIVRHKEPATVKVNEQKLRSKNNVSSEKTVQAVATDSSSEEKN